MSHPAANSHLIYIDTETTGLNAAVHDVFEVAYAGHEGPVTALALPHTLRNADSAALQINRYHEREMNMYAHFGPREQVADTDTVMAENRNALHLLYVALRGKTIVAENYGFDIAMLTAKLGYQPWRYRPIELSSVAMTVFNLHTPEGMAKTADRLRREGYAIPEPDHTASADVECLRACYQALRKLRGVGFP